MTAGEHAVSLLARHFGMPQFAPKPSLRNPERYITRNQVTDDRVSIQVRPPIEFGGLLKECARVADMSYGAYVVAILEQAVSRGDLLPEFSATVGVANTTEGYDSQVGTESSSRLDDRGIPGVHGS
ncbi:hypothetical protein [Microbacterium sp. nov. GSS16]|uniref:hypothetical protein n=1 Tax=Microbacterium sp. nov. GSS16 TaxID=3019890 RepID=UPI0023057951|nr:hypothetical protein [Microbacterium sp. nov. GSS16]WCD91518.1 hypothetical protein PGB26_07330 [Microbacterium sp. nov. GSS16]